MLALIFAAVVAQTETVTFTHPCAHSSIVLEAFGKEIGETIRPSGSVNKDYFLIRFDKMPVEDAKAAIAKTLNATWTKTGDVLYLTRPRAQELAEENAINEVLRRAIQRNIDAATKRMEARKPLILAEVVEQLRDGLSDRAGTMYAYEQNPLRRFQDRIEATFTVEDLMSLPFGTTYYSDDERSGDLPFPRAWIDAKKASAQDQEIWRQAIEIANPKDNIGTIARAFQITADKIELEFRREPSELTTMVKLESPGSTMTSALSRANGFNSRQNQWSNFYRELRKPAEVSKEILEAWNYAESRSMRDNYFWVPQLRDRTGVPRLFEPVFSDLVNNEPLTTLVSWQILQAAERKETNIVALFGDGILERPFDLSIEEGMPLRAFFVNGKTGFLAQFDEAMSCWMARPQDPANARKSRMDRAAFGALLKSISADGWSSLTDAVEFISRAGAQTMTPGWQSILAASEFSQQKEQTWFSNEYNGLAATDVYARLTPTQRLQATRGGVEIPLASWPAGVWPALESGYWRGQRMVPPGLEPYDVEARFGRRVSYVLGQRLPAGTVLRVQVSRGTELWVGRDKNGVQLDLETFAHEFVKAELGVPDRYDVDRVAVAIVETLLVELVVPNVGSHEMKAVFERIPFLDELGPVEELPTAARTTVLAAIQKARDGLN